MKGGAVLPAGGAEWARRRTPACALNAGAASPRMGEAAWFTACARAGVHRPARVSEDQRLSPKSARNLAMSFSGQGEVGSILPMKKRSTVGS